MRPTPKQKEAIRLLLTSKKPVLWPGSIRSGKTVGGAIGLTLHAQARKNANYILAGKSYTVVKRNVLAPIQACARAYGIPHKFHHAEGILKLGKSEVHVFGANNEASQDYLQGMTADGFFLDELPLLPKSFFMQAIARCSNPSPFMLATLNKVSPNHWTKTEVYDSDEFDVVESTLDDNPHISGEARHRYDVLLTGHYGARMVGNQWADATGRIWSEIPEWMMGVPVGTIFAGVDAAQSGTTAAVFIQKVDVNTWAIVGEYTHKGVRQFAEHAAQIAQWRPMHTWCDPSSPGLIAALRAKHLDVSPANTDVLKGIQTTEAAIRMRKLYVVADRAPNLLKEMSGYVWDEKAALQGEDKPVKQDDHHCDALRYVVIAKIPMVSLQPVKKGKGL